MTQATREIKVGLFIFIAFVLLAVVVFSISDFYTAQPQYSLRVRFQFANGVEVGAPVRLAGIHIGEIRSVRIYWDEANQRMQAELAMRLIREAKIVEDSIAYINTLGLIGEKYVEIIPGTKGARILSAGEVLEGKDSIPMERVVESGYRVLTRMEDTIASLQSIVGDEKVQASLKGTLANTSEASERLNQFLENANAVMLQVRSGEGTVGKLLTQDDLYRDLQAILSDIKAHPWKLLYRPREKK